MKKYLLALSLFLLSLGVNAQKKVSLRVKLKKGDVYTQTIEGHQIISIVGTIMPQNTIFVIKNEVLALNSDDTYKVKMTYTRVAMKQENPQLGTQEYDSDKSTNANGPLKQGLSKMLNKNVVYNMNNLGDIVSIDKSNMPLDKKELLKQIKGSVIPLPKKAVSIGDTWEEDTELRIGTTLLMGKNTFKLTKIKGSSVTVEVSTSFLDKSSKEKGNQKGERIISTKTGLTTEANVKQNLNQIVSNGVMMDVESTIKITTKIK